MGRHLKSALRGIAALLGAFALGASAQVGISPQYLDVSVDGAPRTHVLRLHNLGDAPKTVEVSVSHWRFDEAGKVEVIAPDERSMQAWLIVNPLRFELQPKSAQTVRLAVRVPPGTPEGEYRAMVYFDEVLGPAEASDRVIMRARFRIGAAVYGQVGQPVRSAEAGAIAADAGGFSIPLRATGTANTRFNARYAIWRADALQDPDDATVPVPRGAAVQPLPEGMLGHAPVASAPVLPGTSREVRTDFDAPLPAGDYVLAIDGTLGAAPFSRRQPFTIPAD